MGKVRRAKRRKTGKAWIVSFVPGIGKDLELAAAVCADNGAAQSHGMSRNEVTGKQESVCSGR